MEAIPISLKDYTLSGGGANGESYDHKTDPSVMLKLYFPGKIQQPLDEMLLARKVYAMGIPTPEPGEYVVTEDGRYGIRFKRILGKTSYSRATGDHPEKVQQYADEFARMCLQLHATHIDTSKFENVKDRYYRLLEENPFFTPEEKEKLRRFIANVPDEDTAIHGDLQFSRQRPQTLPLRSSPRSRRELTLTALRVPKLRGRCARATAPCPAPP